MTCPPLRTYYVVSPQTLIYPGTDVDPPEYGCYVDEVQATSKREAIKVAYADPNAEIHRWARDARGDGRHPFSGITVDHPHCEHDVCCDAPLLDGGSWHGGGFNCEACWEAEDLRIETEVWASLDSDRGGDL